MSQLLNQTMGYGRTPNLLLVDFEQDNPDVAPTIAAVLEELASIDEQLTAARSDSMALKVGDLEVDYRKHVVHLKSEGSRLLKQLEALTEVKLRFDKYSGRLGDASTSTSVVSYW